DPVVRVSGRHRDRLAQPAVRAEAQEVEAGVLDEVVAADVEVSDHAPAVGEPGRAVHAPPELRLLVGLLVALGVGRRGLHENVAHGARPGAPPRGHRVESTFMGPPAAPGARAAGRRAPRYFFFSSFDPGGKSLNSLSEALASFFWFFSGLSDSSSV